MPDSCEAQNFQIVSLRLSDMRDTNLAQAIVRSRNTLGEFLATFDSRTRAQTDFLVVVLNESADSFTPVGIRLDAHDHDTVSGRMVPNGLLRNETERVITCPVSEILDWRLIDTFEMEGGIVYRELFGRQSRRVQFTIRDAQQFLIDRTGGDEICFESLKIFRHVANARCDELRRLSNDVLLTTTAEMPVLGFDIGRRVCPVRVSIGEYAAMYGNRAVVDLLLERKVLDTKGDATRLLLDSSQAGNCDTTRALVEAGCDIECTNEGGDTPLMQAVTWDHADTVSLLLARGANPNARDNSGQTPVFRARSVGVAEALIRADALVSAIDDHGDSCLAVQHFRGNCKVVKILIEHGAELTYGPRGVAVETRVDGRDALLEWLQSTDNSDGARDMDVAASIDYGYVLPVKSFPKDYFYRED